MITSVPENLVPPIRKPSIWNEPHSIPFSPPKCTFFNFHHDAINHLLTLTSIFPKKFVCISCFLIRVFYYYLVCEAIGTAATPGILCQPWVIVKMIAEKQMECRLAGETEVLGENMPQRHFCPSQNPT
jgi:hypothetical protein